MPWHTCYVEVFGGAGWVLFGKKPSEVEILNDIDKELINFFRVVREKPQEFLNAFEFELISREIFTEMVEMDLDNATDIQRARRFFYLIMASWGGEMNYPRMQTSITDGGGGNRLIGALKTLKNRISPVHSRLSSVIIENLDWKACIQRYDSPTTLFYLDPPYPGNGVNYKHNIRDWETHEEMARVLKNLSGKWILSSYDRPEVRAFYEGYNFVPVTVASGMETEKFSGERVKVAEILVTNFEPKEISSNIETALIK